MSRIPALPAIPVPGATAYLVGWRDCITGLFTDAGIYSEAAPTTMLRSRLRPVPLLSMQSRFAPAVGGYERAVDSLAAVVEKTPQLAWATRTRTYRLMERNRKRMYAERAARLPVTGRVIR